MPTPSIRDRLAPELPYLRRYARALTGTQKSGDSWVRATLEAVLTAPDSFNADADPRVELYRLFHAFWSPHAHGGSLPDAGLTLGEASLAAIPLAQREALLLTALEGFATADAARILARTEADVAADAEAARRAITSAMAGRVLIIEDEPLIAMHLEAIVTDMGH
ncbi:MAG: response regulator, partial [Thermaurantiacus sp.]